MKKYSWEVGTISSEILAKMDAEKVGKELEKLGGMYGMFHVK